MRKPLIHQGLLAGVLAVSLSSMAVAQSKLPQPDPAFKGKIADTYDKSTPSYPQPLAAAKGSPNVLLILLDDVGFGMCSTFSSSKNS